MGEEESESQRLERYDPSAEVAAQLLLSNPEAVAPAIDGYVRQTMVQDLCNEIKVKGRDGEVTWLISKGSYDDVEGRKIQLASRVPTRKRGDDNLDDVLSSTTIIRDGNIGNVVGYINHGFIQNNDEAMTMVLPQEPAGCERMIQRIYETSASIAESQKRDEERKQEQRSGKRVRHLWRAIGLGVVGLIGVVGVPRGIDEYDEYDQRVDTEVQQEADATAAAQAEATAQREAEIAAFDAAHPDIEEAVVVTDGERQVLPANREFVTVDNVPELLTGQSYEQLQNVRSLPAPAVGTTSHFQIRIPEGASFKIAHTGDEDLLVTATVDSGEQMIHITSVNVFPTVLDRDGVVVPPPTPFLGEIVLTVVE